MKIPSTETHRLDWKPTPERKPILPYTQLYSVPTNWRSCALTGAYGRPIHGPGVQYQFRILQPYEPYTLNPSLQWAWPLKLIACRAVRMFDIQLYHLLLTAPLSKLIRNAVERSRTRTRRNFSICKHTSFWFWFIIPFNINVFYEMCLLTHCQIVQACTRLDTFAHKSSKMPQHTQLTHWYAIVCKTHKESIS